MRKLHRQIAFVAIIIGLFISITGLLVQSMDIASELRSAPATDPTMKGRRAGLFGPPNFQVLETPDFAAEALPAGFDYDAALATTVKSLKTNAGDAPINFVQFRMSGNRPVGQVGSRSQLYSFDATTGAPIGAAQKIDLKPVSTPSTRNMLKDIHRLRWFGAWTVLVDAVAGLIMCFMIVSGLVFYTQLWRARARMKRTAPFWYSGTWWRTIHRGAAIVASLFLSVIAVTGTIEAIGSTGVTVTMALHGGKRPALVMDLSRPMTGAEMSGMLHSALQSFKAANPNTPIKVLRLRYFAGMPQGVFVTGGTVTDQIVYNTATGATASLSEPNYPATGQTFGWQVDETAKKIHRGDIFGLTGMWMSLLSGLALLYISVSGGVMYYDLWKRRSKQGKKQLIW